MPPILRAGVAVAIIAMAILGANAQDAGTKKVVGGYVLLSAARSGVKVGLEELALLSKNAATLPVNRIWYSFFSPTLVYEANSNTLEHVGLGLQDGGDYGFADMKKTIAELKVNLLAHPSPPASPLPSPGTLFSLRGRSFPTDSRRRVALLVV